MRARPSAPIASEVSAGPAHGPRRSRIVSANPGDCEFVVCAMAPLPSGPPNKAMPVPMRTAHSVSRAPVLAGLRRFRLKVRRMLPPEPYKRSDDDCPPFRRSLQRDRETRVALYRIGEHEGEEPQADDAVHCEEHGVEAP